MRCGVPLIWRSSCPTSVRVSTVGQFGRALPLLMPPFGPPISDAEDLPKQVCDGRRGLVPRLGRKATFVGQVAQVLIHVRGRQSLWIAIVVEVQKPANPSEIRLFGPRAPLPCSHPSAQAGQKGSVVGGRAPFDEFESRSGFTLLLGAHAVLPSSRHEIPAR